MNIKIEGKEHREGKSKAGKDYNFNIIHFLAPRAGVEGLAAYEKIIDPALYSYDSLLTGAVYEVEVDMTGAITSIKPAKA